MRETEARDTNCQRQVELIRSVERVRVKSTTEIDGIVGTAYLPREASNVTASSHAPVRRSDSAEALKTVEIAEKVVHKGGHTTEAGFFKALFYLGFCVCGVAG